MPKSRECSPEKCPIENPLNKPVSPQIVHRTNLPNDSSAPTGATSNNTAQFNFPQAFTTERAPGQTVDNQRHLSSGGVTDQFVGASAGRQEDSSVRRSQTAPGAGPSDPFVGASATRQEDSSVRRSQPTDQFGPSAARQKEESIIRRSAGGGPTKMSNIIDTNDSGIATDKVTATKMGVLYYLNTVREPIVDYQESRGISRFEEITFVTLITSLCTQAYTAAITILVMLWNLMPLVDGFVYFFRFVLDKIIDIIQTDDVKEKAIKGTIFIGELTVTLFLIFLIMGLIFMPVYMLLAQLVSKIFSMIAW